jgi:hypothetical protein
MLGTQAHGGQNQLLSGYWTENQEQQLRRRTKEIEQKAPDRTPEEKQRRTRRTDSDAWASSWPGTLPCAEQLADSVETSSEPRPETKNRMAESLPGNSASRTSLTGPQGNGSVQHRQQLETGSPGAWHASTCQIETDGEDRWHDACTRG